jgi:hypothetical protein
LAGVLRQRLQEGAVKLIGWVLAGLGLLAMGWLIWQDGRRDGVSIAEQPPRGSCVVFVSPLRVPRNQLG